MLRFLVGDFKKVNARTATYIPERPVQSGLTDSLGNARLNKDTPKKAVDVDDQCMFMIECENGAFGALKQQEMHGEEIIILHLKSTEH